MGNSELKPVLAHGGVKPRPYSQGSGDIHVPEVSIIIPVFNAERTLSTCLASVLGQSFADFEVILVNDGSRDHSLDLCKDFAQLDPRISVISQENLGPGSARNAGLALARGRYVQFVDADDILLPQATEKLVMAMQDLAADLVIAHFKLDLHNTCSDKGLVPNKVRMSRPEFFSALSDNPGSYYYSVLWNKLYLRSLIEEKQLRFRPDLSWGEDLEFNLHYYAWVRQVAFLPDPVYHYFWTRSGQTWRSLFQVRPNLQIKQQLYHSLRQLYQAEGLYSQYRWQLTRYIFNITLLN